MVQARFTGGHLEGVRLRLANGERRHEAGGREAVRVRVRRVLQRDRNGAAAAHLVKVHARAHLAVGYYCVDGQDLGPARDQPRRLERGQPGDQGT